jgi:hypothetical protein
MAIPTLSGSYIDETYIRLVQVSGSEFSDGLGNTISFGPGSLSGGINGYIPLWSGSNALTSSFLQQTNNIIQTVYEGATNSGILLNLSHSEYRFGSWNTGNFTNIIITDELKVIDVDSVGEIRIGDTSANQTQTILSVNDTNQSIKTSQGGFDKGLSLDFANQIYAINTGNNSEEGLYINVVSGTTKLTDSTGETGLFIDGNSGSIITKVISGSLTNIGPAIFSGSVISTLGFTGSLLGTATNATNAENATTAQNSLAPISYSGSTIYSTNPVSVYNSTFSTNNSIFLGNSAGHNGQNSYGSNFLGFLAGNGLYYADSTGSSYYSNYLGYSAGAYAFEANNSNFLGYYSGRFAISASNSNFFGNTVGARAVSASYSTLIGYNVGSYSNTTLGSAGIKSNNIIIGTNITLPNGRQDSINIGGILFGTGSYFNTSSTTPSSGTSNGRIGINVVNPTYTLDVSGSVKISNELLVDETLTKFAKYTNVGVGVANNVTLFSIATGSYTSAFGKYTIYSGSNSRAGELMTSRNGTTVNHTDVATNDIGSTAGVILTSQVSQSYYQIIASFPATGTWDIKMMATYI